MWWNPETEAEHRLSELPPRLVERFLNELEKEVVWGVGSFFPLPKLRLHSLLLPYRRKRLRLKD